MSENSNEQWPTMPGSFRPATSAAADPLRVERRKTLAPEPLPGQAHQPAAPALAADPAMTPADQPPQSPAAAQIPVTEAPATEKIPCLHCGVEVTTWESFCEACGGELMPTTTAPVVAEVGTESPIETTQATAPAPTAPDLEIVAPQSCTCSQCGGVVGPDGYCTQCGTKGLSPRDHYTEAPSPWVAGCCDKGLRHPRNEDAIALWSPAGSMPGPDSQAVLIVCDGVSSSEDSDIAALAAARRARDVLTAARPQGLGIPESKDAAWATAFEQAVDQANDAVVASTRPESRDAASCTFVGAVVDGNRIHYANVGDSRAYWVDDDPARAQMLSLDDSIAQARIALGVTRDEAEHGYQAHAITKWLGRDCEDHVPRTGALDVPGPGWLLVCSDGLWNYCTEPADLSALVRAVLATTQATTVLGVAEGLVAWANAQGGKDNISATLARFGPWPQVPPPVLRAQTASEQPATPTPAPATGEDLLAPAPGTLEEAPTEGH